MNFSLSIQTQSMESAVIPERSSVFNQWNKVKNQVYQDGGIIVSRGRVVSFCGIQTNLMEFRQTISERWNIAKVIVEIVSRKDNWFLQIFKNYILLF